MKIHHLRSCSLALGAIAAAASAEVFDTAALRSQKANLLSDIGFEFAQIKNQRAIEVLDQAQGAIAAMTEQCYQANSIARVAGGYLLLGEMDKGESLLTEAIETAKAQDATRCSSSATLPTVSLLSRATEFAQAGQIDLAIQLASKLNSSLVSPETAQQFTVVQK